MSVHAEPVPGAGRADGGHVEVAGEQELREILGEPMDRAITKERATLHPHHVAWIERSPFCLIATSDAEGRCDVSPKGDPPGFVKVLDERTLAIPERPGNRRADGYLNMLANPRIGLIFFVPGREDTLRVNGTVRILRDAPFFDLMEVKGHRPQLALLVGTEEIFFHCAKAFKRSRLWKHEEWPDPAELPSVARLSKDIAAPETDLAELERYYGPEYEKKLYGY
ncbi:MAG: pyridoxamine 5'-phosphate oxidase family protein [Streptosporangiales bacterium]|nr:pyridoxamine 5'-phosphate oxidase family protein [Streptosporangiales bacterium]